MAREIDYKALYESLFADVYACYAKAVVAENDELVQILETIFIKNKESKQHEQLLCESLNSNKSYRLIHTDEFDSEYYMVKLPWLDNDIMAIWVKSELMWLTTLVLDAKQPTCFDEVPDYNWTPDIDVDVYAILQEIER